MPATDTQERIWKAREVVQDLTKALKAHSQFGVGHPHYRRTLDQVQAALRDYLERYGPFVIRPVPEGFRLEGEETFPWERGLPLRMFMDGIREIALHPGIEPGEIEGFLEIAQTDPAAAESDLVSQLWQRGFPHVAYFALDELYTDFMGLGEDELAADPDVKRQREAVQALAEDLERAQGAAGSALYELSETGEEVGAAGAPAAAAIPAPSPAPPSPALEPEEAAALAAEVAALGAADLVPRATDVLTGLLRADPAAAASEEVSRFAGSLVEAALSHADFPTLNAIVERLKEIEGWEHSSPATFARRTLEGLAEPGSVLRVLSLVSGKYSGGAREVFRYFQRLPAAALKTLCGSYSGIGSRELRRAVRELLASRIGEDLGAIEGMLSAEEPAVVRDGLQILAGAGGGAVVPYVEKAFLRPEEEIREHALFALLRTPASARANSLAKLLRDPSPKIVAAAARQIASSQAPQAGRLLLDWVRRPEFTELSPEAKRAALESLRIAGGSLGEEWLRKHAEARGLLLKRGERELRRLAEEVLQSEIRVPEAPGAPGEGGEGEAAEAPPAAPRSAPRPPRPAPPRTGAAAAAERRGFHGEISEVPVPEILQLLSNARRSGCLEIMRPDGSGRVFLADGEVVHASVPGLEGDEALLAALGWPDGEFLFVSDRAADRRTVRQPLQALLLEAARRLDERGKGA